MNGITIESVVLAFYLISGVFLLLSLFGLRRLFGLTWTWPFIFIKTTLYITLSFLCLVFANQLSQFFPIFGQKPIVTVSMNQLQGKNYKLHVFDGANPEQEKMQNTINQNVDGFLINGDQWQLEMRVLTWHPLLAELGLQPLYKLERLSGRYQSIEDEKGLSRSLYQLEKSGFSDGYWQMLLPYLHDSLINSYYGTSVFAPMAEAAQYGVFLNRGGADLKPLNEQAKQALRGW